MPKIFYDKEGKLVGMQNGDTERNGCKYHSGIVQRLDDLSWFGKLAMIVFVIIGMAVIGSLWSSYSSLSNKIDVVTGNQIKVMTKQDTQELWLKAVDAKIEQHLKEWPSLTPKSHEDRKK